ncbi:MAG: glycine cleavage system protein GcvH [Deltaproteobacteria bacterium]|nr:glycine cleavage system protein GcvH [Deltaproteobacteria bacterium]TLN02704.1 MAG: glycine cleavage system protein GcvH [bacterium]
MDYYFTKEHEWLRLDGQSALVGISAYAVEQLGDITFVELPRPGKEAKQSEVLCAIESVKAASDIYAPVSGRVIAVNEQVENGPEIVNQSPEEEGWLVRIELADPGELRRLMNREQYRDYLEGLS